MLTGTQLASAETLQKIIDIVPHPIFVKDTSHRWVLLNKALTAMIGLPPAALLGKSDFDIFPPAQASVFWDTDDAVFRTGEPNENEELFTDGAGETRTVITRKRLLRLGEQADTVLLVGVISDITDIRRTEARARHLAAHDPLTGLLNRPRLREHLDQAVAQARRAGERVAVLCVDLDRFKAVNDALGHAAGDEVLRIAADRLIQGVRAGDVVARIGGDEFVVVQTRMEAAANAEDLAARLVRLLGADFDIGRPDAVSLSASVGIAIFPTDATDPETLLAHADAALYRVKQEGRNGYAFFHAAMDAAIRARRAMEQDVRSALARGEFSLVFQPQADAETRRVVGFEALLRWYHHGRGIVSPSEFVPAAEACGAIIPIGAWVLREACGMAARWQSPLRIAVNISAAQIHHAGFVQTVAEALAESGLDPGRLELEVTESLLIRDIDRALATLRQIKALGVRVALDDFGTGYSSLSTLSAFPFDRVKIDRSFVRDLPHSGEATAIVRAVLALGRGLHMRVVAEGVETLEQLAMLRSEGCEEVQGYLIERPRPIDAYASVTDAVPPPHPLAGGCGAAAAVSV